MCDFLLFPHGDHLITECDGDRLVMPLIANKHFDFIFDSKNNPIKNVQRSGLSWAQIG